MNKISCIVLSHNSHLDKGFSALLTLYSILRQDYYNFEVVFVENSSEKPDIDFLKESVSKFMDKLNKVVPFKIVNNKTVLTYGKARNKGARVSKGDILVFVDDDTIIVGRQSFRKIVKLSKTSDFGFGAKRYWTQKNIFQENSDQIIQNIVETDDFSELREISGPPPRSRASSEFDKRLHSVSFISNFGFCKKDKFNQVGGFISFPGYGFEDDHLSFELFKNGYKFINLEELNVVHINHDVNPDQISNFPLYLKLLIEDGYFWFNALDLATNSKASQKEILVPLKTVHYDHRIENAYKNYTSQLPLNQNYLNKKELKSWKKNIQYSLIEYTRKIKALTEAEDIDTYIRSSRSDLDNLAIVIKSAIESKIVEIDELGIITNKLDFKYSNTTKKSEAYTKMVPDSKLNQYPCDQSSRKRRHELIKERYPFCEYLRIGIIGDDDFLSTSFKEDVWVWPIVIEKDKRIINKIENQSDRVEVHSIDVRKINSLKPLPHVKTFITDPPYTLNGALAFVAAGLIMLEKNSKNEFYVILNNTMMGKYIMTFQQILIGANVFLTEIRYNFSQYELPENFDERKRADAFLKTIGVDKNKVKYSSSSSLYIFETQNPDIKWLIDQINYERLYNHYI